MLDEVSGAALVGCVSELRLPFRFPSRVVGEVEAVSVGTFKFSARSCTSHVTRRLTFLLFTSPAMAELSVVFKRTKSKPVPRARERSPDGTDAAEISAANITTGAEDSPSTLATKLKNKAKRSKPKARLSFGGDNEVRSRTQLKCLCL